MSDQAPAVAPKEKRGRGRLPGFSMSEEHRDKIRKSNILSALISHVTEGREMSASQVTAGLGLLRKVMPDLATTTLQGDEDGGPIQTVSKIELVAPSLNDNPQD